MRIQILAIDPSDPPRVTAHTDLGDFAGPWSGSVPEVGAFRSVELGIDDTFTWGVEITVVDECPHSISSAAGGGVVLHATLERLRENNYVGLRLGGSIVMLDVEGDPPPIGVTIRLEAPLVTLFDINT